jgi:hypothetical protein
LATITRTNLATNPSFEAPDFNTTTRVNLCTTPAFEYGTVGTWTDGSNSTYATSTAQKHSGTSSLAVTRSNTAVGSCYARHQFQAVSGLDYSITAWFYGGAGAANTYTIKTSGAMVSSVVTFTPGAAWQKLTLTGTASSTGTVSLYITDDLNNAPVAGTVFYVDEVLIEQATTPGAYFDGDTANTTSFVYLWSGTPGNSTSQAWPCPIIGGAYFASHVSTGGSALAYQDPTWAASDGGYVSLRIDSSLASSTATSCYVGNISSAMAHLGIAPGKTYTISATARLIAAQTGSSFDPAARSIAIGLTDASGSTNYLWAVSPQPPNAPGVYRQSVTFTIPADAQNCFLRLMNGEGPVASGGSGGSVWWDDLLIEEVAYDRGYFDGNTTPYTNTAYSPPGQTSFSWTGTANASTSVQTDIVPLQDYQVQLPDGSLLGAGQPVGLLEVVGLRGAASTRSSDTDRAGVDGMVPGMSYVTGRTVAVKWLITNSGGVEPALHLLSQNWQNTNDPSSVVMTARDYLMQLAGGGTKPISALQFQLPGRPVPLMAFGKPGKLDPPVNSSYQFGWLEVASEWFVPDGKLYDSTVNIVQAALPSSLGGAKFKWTFPVNFGPSTGGSLPVANDGLYPAKPVFRITGPVTNPIITNMETGQFIRVNISLNPGDILVIDADSRVVRLNGANRNTTLDVGSSFFTIPPGGASLSFSSVDVGIVSGVLTAYTLNTYSAA